MFWINVKHCDPYVPIESWRWNMFSSLLKCEMCTEAGALPVVQFVGRPAWKSTLQQQANKNWIPRTSMVQIGPIFTKLTLPTMFFQILGLLLWRASWCQILQHLTNLFGNHHRDQCWRRSPGSNGFVEVVDVLCKTARHSMVGLPMMWCCESSSNHTHTQNGSFVLHTLNNRYKIITPKNTDYCNNEGAQTNRMVNLQLWVCISSKSRCSAGGGLVVLGKLWLCLNMWGIRSTPQYCHSTS
jgi:hypothetical protein